MVRYREIVDLWMAARENAGGSLTQAEEARWAGNADRVWVCLSEDQQDALEAARRSPPASPVNTGDGG